MSAEIVTISHNHPNHSATKDLPGKFHVLKGPGEYEIGGVFIQAVSSFHDAKGGKERGKNIIFRIDIDDLAVCHLGDLGHTLSSSQVAAIGTVHILLIPVGGTTTIDAAQAAEVTSALQPRLVIPMHYNNGTPGVGGLESVDRFCKEMGATGLKPQTRANVTRTNLPAETQVLLLEQVTKGGAR
jgi:L-ascorbate metabolism protein UlaG (beta-lactamase superfamily)